MDKKGIMQRQEELEELPGDQEGQAYDQEEAFDEGEKQPKEKEEGIDNKEEHPDDELNNEEKKLQLELEEILAAHIIPDSCTDSSGDGSACSGICTSS